eukprot:m.543378 g.543378  ORF g.543378 m.543378 type:complete len:59 (+) comp22126_c0_seq10:2035-2211(+)
MLHPRQYADCTYFDPCNPMTPTCQCATTYRSGLGGCRVDTAPRWCARRNEARDECLLL